MGLFTKAVFKFLDKFEKLESCWLERIFFLIKLSFPLEGGAMGWALSTPQTTLLSVLSTKSVLIDIDKFKKILNVIWKTR